MMRWPIESGTTFVMTTSPADTRGSRLRLWLILALITGASLFCSGFTEAAPRRSRGRSSYSSRAAAAARAQRAQLIKNLQNQVSNARQVLSSLESKSVMTQSQLTSASARLEGIQQSIKDSHQDAVAAAKTLRDIEAEIVQAQTPTSEFAKANAAVDDARKAVHETMHEVLKLPVESDQSGIDGGRAELQKLSDSQRDTLMADARYKEADQTLRDAIRTVGQLRLQLFQDDKDWTAAHQDLTDAHQKQRDEEKERRVNGTAVTGKKHELQNMATVAANARSIIAMGEFRLRQLGASTGSTQNKSGSKSSSNSTALKKK